MRGNLRAFLSRVKRWVLDFWIDFVTCLQGTKARGLLKFRARGPFLAPKEIKNFQKRGFYNVANFQVGSLNWRGKQNLCLLANSNEEKGGGRANQANWFLGVSLTTFAVETTYSRSLWVEWHKIAYSSLLRWIASLAQRYITHTL